MNAAWKTVRVFISSTFRDMHAERDHLVKVVFPALRESLLKDCIFLDDIDLRWGVTRQQAENERVLDLCLREIDGCRPFFIGILGERYGWVPVKLPVDACSSFGWIKDHAGKSVTELEILHGVLNDPAMNERAFFYLRDPAFIDDVPSERKQVYLECPTEQEFQELSREEAEACAENRRRQLRELKEKLGALRPKLFVFDNYPCHWDPARPDPVTRQSGRLAGLEAFGESVRQKLEFAIRTDPKLKEHFAAPTAQQPDLFGLAEEQNYHDRFRESRLRVYVGREEINAALLAFADGNEQVPSLVTGPSGSGKSAALARFVTDYSSKHEQAIEDRKILILPHFIGASPRSTNLRGMLRRFCQVFKVHFGFVEDVPEDVATLTATFREFVGKVPANRRVILTIDALNQLDEADRAQELYWLPTELPPHVKVIVSCISESGKTEPVLEAFRCRKHCTVELAALTDAEQRLIIRQVPSLSAKTLDDEQVRLLLSNPATANPLFLLVALEELRGFASYERLNERIAALPRDGDTVTAIFIQVIERLAEEFNQKLVETVLTLLASARRGLSERELQELVAGLDGADDLFPVLRQLRPYLLSRAGLIDFYHRNLFKAVRERFLRSDGQQQQAHARLAEYFNAQDYWLEALEEQQKRAKTLPPTTRRANVRKVDELPWQLWKAGQRQRLRERIADWPLFTAMQTPERVHELIGYWLALDNAREVGVAYHRMLAGAHRDGVGIQSIAAAACQAAGIASRADRHDDASMLLFKFLGPARHELGANHPCVVAMYNGLIRALKALGKIDNALELHHELLTRRRVSAANTGELGESYRIYAGLLEDKGDLAQAERWAKDALQIVESFFGSDHPETALCLHDLSRIQFRAGNTEAAAVAGRRALDIRRRLLGTQHPDTAASMHALGVMLLRRNEVEEAEQLLRSALAVRQNVYGSEHSETATTLNELSGVLARRKEFDAALQYARESLRIRKKNHGDSPAQVATALQTIGGYLLQTGELDEAETALSQALEMRERHLGRDHPDVAVSLFSVAAVRVMQKDFNAARLLLDRALNISSERLGPKHSQTEQIATMLEKVNNAISFLTEQAEPATESSERIEQFTPRTPRDYVVLAELCNQQENLIDASSWYQVAAELYRRDGDEEHRMHCLGKGAELDERLGLLDEAAEHYGQAIEIARALNNKALLQYYLGTLGNLLCRRKLDRQALNAYREEEGICRELGRIEDLVVSLANQADSLLESTGEIEEASRKCDEALSLIQHTTVRNEVGTFVLGIEARIKQRRGIT